MFQVEPSPDFEHSGECRLVIDGKPLEKARVAKGAYDRIKISTTDQETGNQLTSYRLLEFPPLEDLTLRCGSDGPGLIDFISISPPIDERSEKPVRFETDFWCEPDLGKWNRPYGFAQYCEALKGAIEKLNTPEIQFVTFDNDQSYVVAFKITFPFSAPGLPIAREINKHSKLLHKLHEQIESSLVPPDSGKSVAVAFEFPDAVRVPCEQYLLYFVEFLRDLGVEATSELRHQAGKALFTVTRAVVNRCVKGTRRRPLLPFHYRTSFHEQLSLQDAAH